MHFPLSLPFEIHQSAQYGEPPKVVEWLRKGGSVDAIWSAPTRGGRTPTSSLLHAATSRGHLEIVRDLLKQGAAVDLPTNLGYTALMNAAFIGDLSIVLVLLQHSANSDLQDTDGITALMGAAGGGHEACVQALLRAKASTGLLDEDGDSALQYAEIQGHTATAELISQHTAPPQPAAAVALCAVG